MFRLRLSQMFNTQNFPQVKKGEYLMSIWINGNIRYGYYVGLIYVTFVEGATGLKAMNMKTKYLALPWIAGIGMMILPAICTSSCQ